MVVMRGLDVSAWQHPSDRAIDWPKVAAAGYRRVWIKASESDDWVSPWVGRDANGASTAGIAVGFYHVLHPLVDVAAQVSTFDRATHDLHHDFGGAVDVEPSLFPDNGEAAQMAKDFLAGLPATYERRWVYLSGWQLEHMPGAPWGHKLWFASPGVRPRFRVDCWQSSWTDQVPGIEGSVDEDWFYW